MSSFTNDDLKETIRNSLHLSEGDILEESYVAQVKHFNLPTELLSAASKASHIELYENYVKEFNRISAELDTADRKASNSDRSQFRSLKEDETYNMNAIYLHQLYFSNISDLHSEISMDSIPYMRLARDFGTFEAWQEDFIACCMASRCGWAITYFNVYLQSYMNCVIDLHSLNVPFGSYPVIVMDMWQHAYYRDYLRDVKTYTFAMMKQFNWNVIGERFNKAEKIQSVLRS